MAKTGRKLLIVEDDEIFKNTLKSSLEASGYSVMAVPNGKLAQNLVGVNSFDAVITDIRLPEGSGIQLLHYIKKASGIPVILMSGYAEFKTRQEAVDLGAFDYLPKPFKQEDLVAILAKCFNDPIEEEKEDESVEKTQDEMFCKLALADFISGNELQYDIYVRLSDQKYLKIAHKGDHLSADRMNAYRKKNIQYLYMKMDDFKKYVGFNVNLTKMIKTSSTLSKAKKLQFMKNASEVVQTQLHMEGVNEESFENAKTVMESTLSVMTDVNDLMSMLQMLSNHSNSLYAHSLGVSVHATMIAKAVGWRSPLVLFKVTMGGLLHDIGKREIPEEILNKPHEDLTPQEIKILESHTLRGAEILSRVATVPTDVIQIAAQHHENCLGLGYPAALKARFIHPMARLISVANEFCNLTIKGKIENPLKPVEAIQKMSLAMADALDPSFFIALTQVFNVRLQADLEESLRKKRKLEIS